MFSLSSKPFDAEFRGCLHFEQHHSIVLQLGHVGEGKSIGRVSNGHVQPVSPFKRVLLRAIPELETELAGVVNVFDPWARDRGQYYSLQWKPRSGAESDPAFKQP